MLKPIKDFVTDCARIGSFYAHLTMPKILRPIATPIIAVFAAPIMKSVIAYNDYKFESEIKAKVLKHQDISEKEQNIRDIFGQTSINGYTGDDFTIAMEFDKARMIALLPNDQNVSFGQSFVTGYGKNRDECAEDLLGKIASEINFSISEPLNPNSPRERYLAVCNSDSAKPAFYTAAQIFTMEEALMLDSVAIASHVEFGAAEEDRKHYAFLPVDAQTQERLENTTLTPPLP